MPTASRAKHKFCRRIGQCLWGDPKCPSVKRPYAAGPHGKGRRAKLSTYGELLMEKQKLVTEGAGAVSVAAVMFNKLPVAGKKTVCLLSGGNIDVTILSRVIKRGLLMSGRTAQLMIELADKPGQLKNVSRIIADLGGNVISVHHERANEGSDVTGCYLRIMLETRNYDHIAEIKKALTDFGFKLL